MGISGKGVGLMGAPRFVHSIITHFGSTPFWSLLFMGFEDIMNANKHLEPVDD